MTLSRDEVLGAIAKRRKHVEIIEVPEWGGTLGIRLLTAQDVEESGLADGRRDATMFAKVIAACVTDEEGTPLFSAEDVKALQDADMVTSAKVFAEIMRVNGLMDADMQEAVENLGVAQPVDSSSG